MEPNCTFYLGKITKDRMRPIVRCMPLPIQLQALIWLLSFIQSESPFIIDLLKLPFFPIICLIYLIFTCSHARDTNSLTRNEPTGRSECLERQGGKRHYQRFRLHTPAWRPCGVFLHLKLYESRWQIVYLILCNVTPSRFAQSQPLG